MVAAVDAHGWDGAWFLRAYDFFGKPMGSAANDEGRIFVEPQGICVMAGIGLEDGRARNALDSVARSSRRRTDRAAAAVILAYQVALGEISSYPPGYKENGGMFCHTNPWVVIAEGAAGKAGRRPRLLPADQPLRPRRDLGRPSLRAVRVRADDRRAATQRPMARRRTRG